MYDTLPFHATPERAEIVSDFMRRVATTDSVFSDHACEEGCLEKTLVEMCKGCLKRMRKVARILTAPDTLAFEVWSLSETTEPAGIIFLTHVVPGLDAIGHYIFFDQKLGDKTEAIEGVMDALFELHELQRITIEIPEPFVALARHASKKLGFGGPFKWKGDRISIHVEGVKRNAAVYKGEVVDLLVLGKTRPSAVEAGDLLSSAHASR